MRTSRITASLVFILLAGACGPSGELPAAKEEDQVNIGFGTISRDRNTYSVSKVKMEKKETCTYSNMYDYLRGRVPGVTVTSNNSIIIRGISSNNQSDPLILVDGVEVQDLNTLDPSMVRSVEVLKDGSASIYGMRGAFGVILITTK